MVRPDPEHRPRLARLPRAVAGRRPCLRALLALPFVGLLGLAARQERAHAPVELELVYLANEGFLARVGELSLLIDAFVTAPYAGYAAVPDELFIDLLAGKPPFDGIDLALASHVHHDHFQAAPAAEFVRARPEVSFLSSPQVMEELTKALGEQPGEPVPPGERRALLPEARSRLAADDEPIRVELLRLAHSGGARTASVQNLGHLIELGGARILHVGDADVETEELATYELAKAKIDVALVPYWWLGDVDGVALARARTGAGTLVAVHVPPAEVALVKARLAALDPAILLFESAGEGRRLALAR